LNTASSAWRILGLAPCDDERAVRKAYAAKLKSIDAESDIDGFQRLRQAYEMARREAIWRRQSGEEVEQVEVFESLPPDAEEYALTESSLGEDQVVDGMTPPADQPRDPAHNHMEDLQRALFGESFTSFHAQNAAEAVGLLLEDGRMETVDHAQNIEGYLAAVLGDAIPRSDKAIVRADQYFGWRQELQKATPAWHILRVAHRASDLECMDVLADPAHKWHEAFEALRLGSPDRMPYSKRVRVSPSIMELMASLRYHNPGVEEEFDADAVRSWLEFASTGPSPDLVGGEGGGISWYGVFFLLFVLFQVIRLLV
jgi:hypothetical protein